MYVNKRNACLLFAILISTESNGAAVGYLVGCFGNLLRYINSSKEINMKNYHHYVSGFFVHPHEAESVASKIIENGLPNNRVHIFNKDSVLPPHTAKDSSDEVLKDVIVDGTIGTIVGGGLGLLGQVALVASNVTLFVASPLLAPLAMLGWGASIGGVIGASVGAAEKAKTLSNMVHDAILAGQVVVVAETVTTEETAIAGKVIKEAIGDYSDTADPISSYSS